MKIGVPLLALVLVLTGAGVYLFTQRDQFGSALPLLKLAPALIEDDLPFSVPDGFAVSLVSDDVPGARVLGRDPIGTLVVSLTSLGTLVALPDADADGRIDSIETILEGLDSPHGFTFLCDPTPVEGSPLQGCRLYVAEEGAVTSYLYDAHTRTAQFDEKIADLPEGGGHSTRTLLPHPDGRLLVSIGSSCNVCEESDERRAAIYAIDLSTKEMKPFATGLRNTVFMAIEPVSGAIWGTDMGRDFLGDDLPPDEVNILREGSWYGWPWFYGKNTFDEQFRPGVIPSFVQDASPSHLDIPAHSAPLGLAFVPEEGWPEDMWYDLLVAYHGSWNRSSPTGYKIVRFPLDARGMPEGPAVDFMTGFIGESGIYGRPVDIIAMPGGSLWISDDRAGAIYRIRRI